RLILHPEPRELLEHETWRADGDRNRLRNRVARRRHRDLERERLTRPDALAEAGAVDEIAGGDRSRGRERPQPSDPETDCQEPGEKTRPAHGSPSHTPGGVVKRRSRVASVFQALDREAREQQ